MASYLKLNTLLLFIELMWGFLSHQNLGLSLQACNTSVAISWCEFRASLISSLTNPGLSDCLFDIWTTIEKEPPHLQSHNHLLPPSRMRDSPATNHFLPFGVGHRGGWSCRDPRTTRVLGSHAQCGRGWVTRDLPTFVITFAGLNEVVARVGVSS